jgi:hypothetical protein
MITTHEIVDRLDYLQLLIEPSPEDQQEIKQLQRSVKNQPHIDDSDPDPDGSAARQHMIWSELYNEEKHRNVRSAVLSEKYYAQRSKEMNSIMGFRH